MYAKLFLDYLFLLRKPESFFLEKNGIDGWDKQQIADAISTQVKRTTPIIRDKSLDTKGMPDDLVRLYGNHDLGNIHMLWTSFWSEPKKLKEGWGFADMSETNIVLVPDGRIEAYNAYPIRAIHGESQFQGALAQDLDSYLEAMLYGAMNTHHFISGFPDANPILFEKTVLVAKICALMAGGDEYYDFWAETLGL